MRIWLATVVFLAACGGSSGGNPDAAVAIDAIPDAGSTCPAPTALDPSAELTIAGEAAAAGMFDPSLVYPTGAAGGALAYSAVPDQETIRTHVAVSSDGGATWTRVAEANTPEAVAIAADASECAGGTCTGNLISEVPSLVYDADDPDVARRWKLFAHRYVVGPGVALHYGVGTIALQTAPAPDGPWTAPQKLIGWTGASAYSSTDVVANVTTLGGTAGDCLALTEPGALWLPGALDLAVGCIYLEGGAARIRIELLRSPDHGAHWASVGTLLRPADLATCSGATPQLNAPDLFVTGGHEYLAISPGDAQGYHGCLVVAIDDPATGHVARDAHGAPVVVRDLTASQFAGACTFADGAGGYLADVGFFQDARPFRIVRASSSSP